MSINVSVVMPVYNAEHYVGEAVESILNQTFRDIEFIIVDDGSIDGSLKIINQFSDPRIVLLKNLENLGLTRTLNKGLHIARGEYIARMDADDISMPERIEKQVLYLDNNKNVMLVGTSFLHIDQNGAVIAREPVEIDPKKIKQRIVTDNKFCHGSIMFRHSVAENFGFYREQFTYAQDYDYCLRLSEHYDLSNLKEFLYCWRFVESSISNFKKGEQDTYAALARKCARQRRLGKKEELVVRIPSRKRTTNSSAALFDYYVRIGKVQIGIGELTLARSFFLKASRLYPLSVVSFFFLVLSCMPQVVFEIMYKFYLTLENLRYKK